MHTGISLDLQQYLAKIEDQSINKKMEGYFPIDIVIDAFEKGEESGAEKVMRELKESFVRKTSQLFLYSVNMSMKLMKKGYDISAFYINPFRFKVILATPVENTYNEDFINDFYDLSYAYTERFREDFDSSMEMMFIRNTNINEEALEVDGFMKVNNGEA